MVASIRIEQVTSESIRVSWKHPQANGSAILFYNLDFGEAGTSSSNSAIIVVNAHGSLEQQQQQHHVEYMIDMLQPDTAYKLRIQAANSVGVGPFSNLIKMKTKALAPPPPHVELISTTYNSIKLKWASSTGSADASALSTPSTTQYNLEIALVETNEQPEEEGALNFKCVYRGPATTFKASKLLDSATYAFRIAAANDDAGQGRWSHEYRFSTTKSPPLITRPPIVTEITASSCLVEWQSAKRVDDSADSLEYCLQIQSRKDADYREVCIHIYILFYFIN